MQATVVRIATYGVVWVHALGSEPGILRREIIHEHAGLAVGQPIQVRTGPGRGTPAYQRIRPTSS